MSNIDDLRLRLEDAERRFGMKEAETTQYSARLIQLVDAVVDDLWVQRRDNERLSFENEEFRTMLLSLLATIEGGDKDRLNSLMAEMAERISKLMTARADASAADAVLERRPEPVFEPAPVQETASEPVTAPIDVETIAAAVAELANNTEAVTPVLDLPTRPSEAESVAEYAKQPAATEQKMPDIAASRKADRNGEFADLYNVLEDICELVDLLEDVDHPAAPEDGEAG